MNGLLALGLRQQAEPNEPGVRPRASALLGRAVLTIERALHEWRTRNVVRPPPRLRSRTRAVEEPLRRGLSEADRARARERRSVALATSSLAVNGASPREVNDFYGAVFKPIDDIIAANAAHNRMVRLLGREERAGGRGDRRR